MRTSLLGLYAAAALLTGGILGLSGSAGAQELRTLSGHEGLVYSVAFSPDGRTIVSGSGIMSDSGGWDRTVGLWDAASGRELWTLSRHTHVVYSVAFSPDGLTIVTGSVDSTIMLSAAASGRELRTLSGHEGAVNSVAFSPDGRTIVSGGSDWTIRLWDAASGRELRRLGGPSNVLSVAFSPNGRSIVSGGYDGTIKLWDAASGRELWTLSGHKESETSYLFYGVTSVAFSPDGRTIVSGGADKTIKLWDAASRRELRTLRGHTEGVSSVAFSPDGRTIVSGGYDGTIKLWDARWLGDVVVASGPMPAPAPIAAPVPMPQAGFLKTETAEDKPVATVSPPISPKPAATPAPQGRRVALIIGNANYKDAPLANPTFDADLVSTSLRNLGFDVTEVKNADFAAFDTSLTEFAAKEEGTEIALFYFAGHGFAIAGDDLRPRNYLMATSANMKTTSDAILRRDGISIDEIIKRISAPAKVTLAFVDACRNDPFHRGAGDRGFDRIGVALSRQIYIGMSTEIGKTAIDGEAGKGSPFAQAFAEKMTTPGLRIDDAFRALREEVSEKTDGKQQPEILQDDLKQGAIVLVKSE